MSNDINYFYEEQIQKYIQQFLRIFQNIYTKHGVTRGDGTEEEQYKELNVLYATKERLSAKLLSNRSNWSATSLPILTAHISELEFQLQQTVPPYHEDAVSYTDSEGNKKGYVRTIGPSYKVTMDTYILADSNNEMLQILEQILILFNPELTIQKSEDFKDPHYLTDVQLKNVSQDEDVPLDNNNAAYTYTLQFEFEIRLQYPENYQDVIHEIQLDVITPDHTETRIID